MEGEHYHGKLKKTMTNVKEGRGHPVSQFLNNTQYWPQWQALAIAASQLFSNLGTNLFGAN